MIWESNRLRRKTSRIAARLARACEKQSLHNDKIASTEHLLRTLVDAIGK